MRGKFKYNYAGSKPELERSIIGGCLEELAALFVSPNNEVLLLAVFWSHYFPAKNLGVPASRISLGLCQLTGTGVPAWLLRVYE